jgi:hypothetical protein
MFIQQNNRKTRLMSSLYKLTRRRVFVELNKVVLSPLHLGPDWDGCKPYCEFSLERMSSLHLPHPPKLLDSICLFHRHKLLLHPPPPLGILLLSHLCHWVLLNPSHDRRHGEVVLLRRFRPFEPGPNGICPASKLPRPANPFPYRDHHPPALCGVLCQREQRKMLLPNPS